MASFFDDLDGNYLRSRLEHPTEIRTHQLKFMSGCGMDKYSTYEIEADDGGPIKVVMFDRVNNFIVTEGPFSSARLKIVVLHSNFIYDHMQSWNEDHFRSKIVPHRGVPFFKEEFYVRLQNGVANLDGLKFEDNSSFVSTKKFRLGVMAVEETIAEYVQEGISDPFKVKAGRGYKSRKSDNPFPYEPVYRLQTIAPGGTRQKSLQENGIWTVGDLLIRHQSDPQGLREILKIADKDWDKLISNARRCNPPPVMAQSGGNGQPSGFPDSSYSEMLANYLLR